MPFGVLGFKGLLLMLSILYAIMVQGESFNKEKGLAMMSVVYGHIFIQQQQKKHLFREFFIIGAYKTVMLIESHFSNHHYSVWIGRES